MLKNTIYLFLFLFFILTFLDLIFYLRRVCSERLSLGRIIIFLYHIYVLIEGWILNMGVIFARGVGRVIFFFFKVIKLWFYTVFKTVFSWVYDPMFFEKLRILFQMILVVVWPFARFAAKVYAFLQILRVYVMLILFFPCLALFFLPVEKIGYYMINNESVSLGRLKELGFISKDKIAAFFNMPPDLVAQPGMGMWQEHAVLCFMGFSVPILAFFAFLVSWKVIPQTVLKSVVDSLFQEVYPEYVSFIHANYIGRYMHFVHDPFFILIDPTFMIPRYRPELEIYYRGDFIYYFLINLEDPYVMQFISPFCFWVFLVCLVLFLPYHIGLFIFFLFFRIVHRLTFYFLKKILLPAFSMSAILKDFQEMRARLGDLVKEWRMYPPFVGEFYVLISMSCFFFCCTCNYLL